MADLSLCFHGRVIRIIKEIKKFSIINAQYSILNCDGDLHPLEH